MLIFNFKYMNKKNFFRDYITFLPFVIVLLPSLGENYYYANKICSFGIINVAIILFVIGAIIDIILNKKESDFISKISFFNVITLSMLLLVLILHFNHFL